MRSSTALSAGSMKGVNAPERAATSQATASATTENTRANPQPAAPQPTRGDRRRRLARELGERATRRVVRYSCHRSILCMRTR